MAYVSILDRTGDPETWGDAEIICGSLDAARRVGAREAQGCLDTFLGLDQVHVSVPDHWIVTGPAGTVTIIAGE